MANIENNRVEIAPNVPIKDAVKDKEVEKKAVLVIIVPKQKSITNASKEEVEMWLENGEFGEGTMAPKICAAIYFLQYHGQKVVITSIEKIEDAINGKAGTIITNKGSK